MARHKVILDVDLANGMPAQDVDDGLALALALACPEIELLGCTTCGGNCRTRDSTVNTLRWLEMAGRGDIPVAEGRDDPFVQNVSASFAFLDDRTERFGHRWKEVPPLSDPRLSPSPFKAHEFIIEMVKRYPGEVTIVKEGSLTNLALALLVAPEIAPMVKEVVHMGGSVGKRDWYRPVPGDIPAYLWRYVLRMNTEFDPEATEIVVRSGIPFTFVTGNVTTRVFLHQEDVERIAAVGTPYHQFMAQTTRPWVRFNMEVHERPGSYMHDPLTLAVVVDRSFCKFVDMHCDFEKFHAWNYPYLIPGAGEPQVSVAVDVDAPRFEEFLVQRLASPLP